MAGRFIRPKDTVVMDVERMDEGDEALLKVEGFIFMGVDDKTLIPNKRLYDTPKSQMAYQNPTL